ncbi:cAMP-specific 3',5'-cyclic phosphodiesterase 4B-like [Protopterus annectens]|uniref:cAMP-specific 3',5'-cyclic phosphodiesterase 4B-like n=1 Tax=Protopterus annectens TaxID=7888 RepID=UPI001CF9A57C|nr:cAMP-specific 3',5'-cyclic phosphodiesterase 4B-like [Protopterus annectens]
MKKSISVLTVTAEDKGKDSPDPSGRYSRSYTSGSTLGAELRRGRRRLSGNLQVPQWRTRDRSRSPECDNFQQRPTTLPLRIPPRIAITHAEPDSVEDKNYSCHILVTLTTKKSNGIQIMMYREL